MENSWWINFEFRIHLVLSGLPLFRLVRVWMACSEVCHSEIGLMVIERELYGQFSHRTSKLQDIKTIYLHFGKFPWKTNSTKKIFPCLKPPNRAIRSFFSNFPRKIDLSRIKNTLRFIVWKFNFSIFDFLRST